MGEARSALSIIVEVSITDLTDIARQELDSLGSA